MKNNTFLFSAYKSENKNITVIPSKNCWIVYLMPFADKGDEHIYDYQQLCIERNLIGIGWRGGFDDKGNIISKKDAPPQYAVTAIDEMKINDIVITRLRNGKYYIGKISSDRLFCKKEDTKDAIGFEEPRFSYIRKVENWCCFNEDELPADITGRLSQQRHKTIERIANDRIKLLMIRKYSEKSNDKMFNNIEIPNIRLNKDNFAKSLNYMELEDLVYLYIRSILPKEYILYPSSCKISKQKYEFNLYNPDTEETVTCQVKNQAEIDVKYYSDDTDIYSSIWLFSGLGYTNDENTKKTNSNGEEIIKIIKKSDLFIFFKDNENCRHMRQKLEKYYVFDDSGCSFDFSDIGIIKINDKENEKIYFKFGSKTIHGFYYNCEFASFMIEDTAYNDNKNIIDKIIARMHQSSEDSHEH